MSVTPWVLYVGKLKSDSEFSHGSALCMRIVEANNLQRFVVVQDCNALRARGVEFPDWLRGVPTLIERGTMMSFAGSEAVIKLATVGAQVATHLAAAPPAAAQRAAQESVPHVPRTADAYSAQAANTNHMSARHTVVNDPRVASDVQEEDDDPLHVGDIVATPPSEETSTKRVTEGDLNRYLEERKRMDAALRERQQQPTSQ